MCIYKLCEIGDKYHNSCYRKIRMKPVDVKSGTHIDFVAVHTNKDPKLKVGDHVMISKYKRTNFQSTAHQTNLTRPLGSRK